MSDKIKIEADASSYVREVDKAIRAQVRWDHAQESLEASLTKLNVKTQTYTTKIKTATAANEKVTRTFKTTANAVEMMDVKIASASKTQSKMADANKTTQLANKALKSDLKDLTSEYAKLHAKTREYHQAAAKKIDYKDYEDLHRSFRNLNSTLTKTEAKLKGTQSQLDKAKTNVSDLKNKIKESKQSVNEFGLSWEGVMRLFATRLTLQAFGAIQQQFVQGIAEATEFGIKVAEVLTLADKGITGLRVAGETGDIAKAFGLDRMDVVEATYQAASNQIVNVGDSMEFMMSAAQLARVGVSSITDSVGLLSSVMNAYNKEASEADDVSAKLWKTVELGRLRIGDIANDFGRLAVMGSTLGVSFEEVAASIATMTIQGNKASVAQTQLRSVFSGLLKPSKDLREVYSEIGVSSGEMMIRIHGLAGTLKILQERTEGSTSEFAKFFRNQRALLGVISNTGAAMTTYENTLAELLDGTISYNEAARRFAEQDATVLDKAWNSLKVSAGGYFDSVVSALATMEKSTGLLQGTANMIDLMAGKSSVAAANMTTFTGSISTMIDLLSGEKKLSDLWYALGEGFNDDLQRGLQNKKLRFPEVSVKSLRKEIDDSIKMELKFLESSNADIHKSLKEKNEIYHKAYETAKKVRKEGLTAFKKDLTDEQNALKKHKSDIAALQKTIDITYEDLATARSLAGFDPLAATKAAGAENLRIAERAKGMQLGEISEIVNVGDLEKLERALTTLSELNTKIREAQELAGIEPAKAIESQEEILAIRERALERQQEMLESEQEAAEEKKQQVADFEALVKAQDALTPKKLKALESENGITEALKNQKDSVEAMLELQDDIDQQYFDRETLINQIVVAEDIAVLKIEKIRNGKHEAELNRIRAELEQKQLAFKAESKALSEKSTAERNYISQLKTELGLLQSIAIARGSSAGLPSSPGISSTPTVGGTQRTTGTLTGGSSQNNFYFNQQISNNDIDTITSAVERNEWRR